jgi:hypothetical protein
VKLIVVEVEVDEGRRVKAPGCYLGRPELGRKSTPPSKLAEAEAGAEFMPHRAKTREKFDVVSNE